MQGRLLSSLQYKLKLNQKYKMYTQRYIAKEMIHTPYIDFLLVEYLQNFGEHNSEFQGRYKQKCLFIMFDFTILIILSSHEHKS